jgi:hypothetical protein
LVSYNGTVFLINGSGQRQGITSADVFLSHGYSFGAVQSASAEDISMPVGTNVGYADGTLVKGPNDPLVYLVTNGQKRGFVSEAAFLGLGFSFANVRSAAVNTFADLPTGANLEASASTSAHPVGVFVKESNGTIWRITTSGRQGIPDWNTWLSYGRSLNQVVPANSADLALTNAGLLAARPSCTSGPVTTGPVSVSLASDSPTMGSVVAGQATSDLAHFQFNGSGAVTQLVLQRTGVSNNSTLTNVYLYNGNTRVTDPASVNSTGQITFNNPTGLFNAPANISVRADILSSAAGQTVGVSFVSGMSGSTAISGSASGSLMTVASATLATAVFQANTVAGGAVNPGTTNYTIWSAPVAVAQRAVWLKSVMFKGVGSASADALANYVLYVDGNQVGTASGLTAINGSNYAVFNTGSYSLATGSHTLEVRADIVKGSNRTMQFTLVNAADIMLTDSSFNVNITPNTTNTSTVFSSNSAGTLNIASGSVTVQSDPSFSGTTTIPGGATNVTLGKYTMTAYGEDVQVNTLVVTFSGATIGASGLNNVTLFANGAQVGSTQQITGSGTTATFNLGSSLIVPAGQTTKVEVHADTIDANNANITSGTLQTSLAAAGANVNNGTGRSSQLTNISVPSGTVTGQSLSVGSGGFTVANNAAYQNQTLSPNSTSQKIGSFVLQAGNNEPIQVTNLAVALTRTDGTTALSTSESAGSYPAYTDISNVKVTVNSGSPSTPQASAQAFNFSQNFTVAQNSTATVDVWGDLGNSGGGDAFKVTLLPTARGTVSNTVVTPGSATVGQQITLNAGTISSTPTFSASGSTPSKYVAALGGLANGSTNNYNFVAANSGVTLNEAKFVVNGTSGAVSSVTVNGITSPVVTPSATAIAASGSSLNTTVDPVTFNVLTSANMSIGTELTIQSEDLLVTAVPTATSVTVKRAINGTSAATHADTTAVTIKAMAYLTGLNIAVPNGQGGVNINAQPTYTAVGTGGISSGGTAQLALTYEKYTSGSSTTTTSIGPVNANTMMLVGSRPYLTATTTSNSGLLLGENHAYDLTVTPDAKGVIQLNSLKFNLAVVGTVTRADSATANAVVRLAIGSTTITGSSCTVASLVVSCSLPSNYQLSANTPTTLSLYVTVGGSLGAAGSSSLTTSLASSDNFSWTDIAGGGSAQTTNNLTYLDNYPTQVWSMHN